MRACCIQVAPANRPYPAAGHNLQPEGGPIPEGRGWPDHAPGGGGIRVSRYRRVVRRRPPAAARSTGQEPPGSGGAGGAPAAPGSVDEVLDLVRDGGGRVTLPRRLLIEAIFHDPGHHSAEELAAAVQATAPEVHLSTIYRNLEELQRLGVVVHSHLGHGPATYHLATAAHAHFVCERCGATLEAPGTVFREMAARALAEHGFEVNPFHFAVPGLCAACRSAAGDDTGPGTGH